MMDYKGQTLVLSVIFVLVGMMLLVPSGTEKALAGIHAVAKGTCPGPGVPSSPCVFSFIAKELSKGSWVSEPTKSGKVVTWTTTGGGAGNEQGFVKYSVGDPRNIAQLDFYNPVFGSNTCDVKRIDGQVTGSCHAGSGQNAEFTYTLRCDYFVTCH